MFLSSKKGKCTTTLFTNNKKDRLLIINMNNITLQATKHMKLLGITLDSELNMNQHSKIIKIKGEKRINQLKCVGNCCFGPSQLSLRNMYYQPEFQIFI